MNFSYCTSTINLDSLRILLSTNFSIVTKLHCCIAGVLTHILILFQLGVLTSVFLISKGESLKCYLTFRRDYDGLVHKQINNPFLKAVKYMSCNLHIYSSPPYWHKVLVILIIRNFTLVA